MRTQIIHHLERAHEMLSHQPKDVGHAKIIEMVLRELNGEPSVKSARPLPSDIFTSLKSSEPYYSLPKGNLLTRYLIKPIYSNSLVLVTMYWCLQLVQK